MGAHPNVILKCTIKADGTTRKLLRGLLAQNREEIPDSNLPLWFNSKGEVIKNRDNKEMHISRGEDELCIGQFSYNTLVMEEEYDESWQISGEEGDLIIFDLVTYGYGEEITLKDLQERIDALETWAIQHSLSYKISISANYW